MKRAICQTHFGIIRKMCQEAAEHQRLKAIRTQDRSARGRERAITKYKFEGRVRKEARKKQPKRK